MTLRFDEPLWLWAVALAVPMAVVGARWFVSMSRVRRWTCILARCTLLLVVVAMLAGATAVRRTQTLAVVAVIDASGSVEAFFEARDRDGRAIPAMQAIAAALRPALAPRGPDDLRGVVVFGREAFAWSPVSRQDPFEEPLEPRVGEGTNIAEALRLARAMIPADATGRIVLVSDGNQTAGDALSEARAARAVAPIDTVVLRYRVESETIVESVDAPTVAPANSPVNVRVTIRATAPARGTLTLLNNGEPIDISPDGPGLGLRLELAPGRRVLVLQTPPLRGRVHRFEAVYSPDLVDPDDPASGFVGDRVAANNRAAAFTFSPAAGAVLLVDGVGGGRPDGPGSPLRLALERGGLEVRMVSAEAMPTDLLGLEAFDLVILQNVPRHALAEQTHALLASYVTDLGGGLVMVGGPESFGAGGWKGSAVEPLLPVVLDLPEQLIKPSAAVVLVLDNSGSMNRTVMGSTLSQMQIANEGAALAVESMDSTDLVGVVVFNSNHWVLVPLGPNSNAAQTAAKIRGIWADGGTNLGPALRDAGRMLDGVEAEVRHVVVLSDGKSVAMETLPVISRSLHERGIMVSTIAVGDRADSETMATMAEVGGGRFYRVIDPNILPRILVKAVRVVRSPLVREGDFSPVVLGTGSTLTDGLPTGVPPLGGLVLTQARQEPTVVYAMATPTGEPLLAHWNAGLGRVAAFTSDAHHWAARWLDWPGYERLWTQIARAISRPPADRRQEFSMELVGDRLRMRLDATDDDGRPQDMLAVPGAVYAPDGRRIDIRLGQTGPGRYEAEIAAEETGTYVAMLAPRRGGVALAPVVGGATRSGGAEYARLESNESLLAAIADVSGGRVIEFDQLHATALHDRAGVRPTEARTPLWPLLLPWAVVLLLVDVGARRIAWDRLLSRELGASLRREAAAAMRGRGEQAAATAERLRRAEGAAARQVEPARGPLTEADAMAIVREQAERRRAEREAARRAQQRVEPATAPTTVRQREDQAPAPESEGGLAAAKRRARQRIEEQTDSKADEGRGT